MRSYRDEHILTARRQSSTVSILRQNTPELSRTGEWNDGIVGSVEETDAPLVAPLVYFAIASYCLQGKMLIHEHFLCY